MGPSAVLRENAFEQSRGRYEERVGLVPKEYAASVIYECGRGTSFSCSHQGSGHVNENGEQHRDR
jgi:hypothetical protein